MNKLIHALVIAISALTAGTGQAQSIYEPYAFTTLAGLALNFGAADNTGALARFNQPWGLAVDGASNVYVADTLNHTIRKIAPGGVVSTLAGVAGSPGFADGPAGAAQFSRPTGLAVNSAGTVVFVADYNNQLIRQISGGVVTTLAGSVGVFGTSDGTGVSAQFRNPFGVALNSAGTLVYVADQNNQTIRRITVPGGVVTTLAGAGGVSGSTDGPNNLARFNTPRGIAVDSGGNVYVADAGNLTVRKILLGGGVSTLAGSVFIPGLNDGPGSGALFSALQGMSALGGPCGVAVDGGGNVYVSDQGNHTIRKISSGGSVTTLAGLALSSSSADGTGSAARFFDPAGVAVDSSGNLFVADTLNHTIRVGTNMPATVDGPCVAGVTWTAQESNRSWVSVASSTNGNKLVAVDYNGQIYTSIDSGLTWTAQASGNQYWYSVVSSADGSKLAAAVRGGQIYTSVDSGVTWTAQASGSRSWSSLACSADGSKLVALEQGGQVFTSIDSGATWTAQASGGIRNWYSVASAADGSKLVAAVNGGQLYTSTDSGLTWTAQASSGSRNWYCVASSADGSMLVAGVASGQLYTSTDSGLTWTARESNQVWISLGSSADGTKLVAVVQGGQIYTSVDSGLTWTAQASGSRNWYCVASSADGSRLVAGVAGGQLYTSGCAGALALACAADKTVECGTPWSFDPPAITTACSGTNITILSTMTNGTCPQVITRTWMASDACGNTNTCSQTVTVIDSTPPVLRCANDKTVKCGDTWTFDAPTASDACSGANVTVTVLSTVTNGLCPQIITRTWTAIDLCGNAGTCSQTVTVVDSTPPIILCAADKMVKCADAWTFDAPTASDACSGANVTVTVLSTVTNGLCPQSITRTWTATDLCGNSEACSQTVTVINTSLPVIDCPKDIVVASCTATQVFYTVSAADACNPSLSVVGSPASGSTFEPGTATTVLCVASNCAGSTTCRFTITVQSAGNCCVAPPTNMVLWLPFDETSGATSINLVPGGNNGTQVNGPVVTSGFVANSLSFDGVSQYVEVPSYNAINFGTGDFSIDAWVRRAAKDPGDSVRTIVDKRDESASVRGYAFFLGAGGTLGFQLSDGTFANYSSALAVANDGQWHHVAVTVDRDNTNGIVFYLDGAADSVLRNPVPRAGSVSTDMPLRVGARTSSVSFIFWGSIDEVELFNRVLAPAEIEGLFKAGSSGKCKPTCDKPPVIHCSDNKEVPCGSVWTFDAPTASDGSGGTNVTVTILDTRTEGLCPQVITRTWIATDACGNTDTCRQTVTVVDETPPVIDCAKDKTVNCADAWTFDEPAASDACSGKDVTVAILRTITNGVCPRVITRTWTATDLCGNAATCSQTVTVVDTTPPVLTCPPPEKMVNCADAWRFDEPAASDACSGEDVRVAILRTVTNGLCPRVITRTWTAADACGNISTCSQTVTVVDTTPPVIICPKKIIVALDANCRLKIPTIHPKASDDCTPRSQLVYTQEPAPGTFVPGPCQLVTVTVTDACRNTSQCQVYVCGQDKTPPTLICPETVTLTNCAVPDARALVSAWDNCSSGHGLTFTQSPPAGTPIAAGGNLVTVTVTDQAGNSATAFISLISSGPQSFLNVLFNTGVDSTKALLPGGSVDPHYTLGPVPVGTPTGPSLYQVPQAIAVPGLWGPWGLPSSASGWIAPGAWLLGYPIGRYTYTNQFVLPPGTDPTTASISGRWAADEGATMYLNGQTPPDQKSFIAPVGGYTSWTYFTVSGGFLPYPTPNKLYCVVTNAESYWGLTGLRLEIKDAVINCSTCAPPVVLHKTPSQSRPLNSAATFSVSLSGTPPLTIQWYHNGVALSNNGHYLGVDTATLSIVPLSYADAGTYYAVISNPCGGVRSWPAHLTVTHGWDWGWGWWDFAQIGRPLAASFGPDLILRGTNRMALSSGTTFDFDLPGIGGQLANVMHVPSLTNDTYLQLPFVKSPGSNLVDNYTLIADVYAPSNATAPAMLFNLLNPGLAGQDHLSLSMMGGSAAAGLSFHLDSSFNDPLVWLPPMPVAPGTWMRVALVVETTALDSNTDAVSMSLYVNGELAGSASSNVPTGVVVFRSDSLATVFSSPEGTGSDLFVSDLQFHAVALEPEMIAGMGSPDNTPIPANDTSVGEPPALAVSFSKGAVSLSWRGGAFRLQETRDLANGPWLDSSADFDETEVDGEITTTAHANPTLEGPALFYRLIYAP